MLQNNYQVTTKRSIQKPKENKYPGQFYRQDSWWKGLIDFLPFTLCVNRKD